MTMDIEDEDDFYAPEEPKPETGDEKDQPQQRSKSDDLEEGEEEDEGAAMDEDDDDSVWMPYRHCRASTDRTARILTSSPSAKTAPLPPLQRMSLSANITPLADKDLGHRQSKYSDIRNIPQRSTANDTSEPPAKRDESKGPSAANVGAPSADKTSAAASKSTIDIDANPIYPAAGKPITQVNIDEGM